MMLGGALREPPEGALFAQDRLAVADHDQQRQRIRQSDAPRRPAGFGDVIPGKARPT